MKTSFSRVTSCETTHTHTNTHFHSIQPALEAHCRTLPCKIIKRHFRWLIPFMSYWGKLMPILNHVMNLLETIDFFFRRRCRVRGRKRGQQTDEFKQREGRDNQTPPIKLSSLIPIWHQPAPINFVATIPKSGKSWGNALTFEPFLQQRRVSAVTQCL